MWISATFALALCAVISKGYAEVSGMMLWLLLWLWGRNCGLNGISGSVEWVFLVLVW